MKLLSLNVALPQLLVYRGATINTGIFKKPVSGPVQLRTLNLDGDRQADLSVHGGPHKAVYAYPSEHYPYWRQELPSLDLTWGMFGENFTTTGVAEDELHVGDRFQIGSSIVMVRQPRTPCYKLAARFQRDDILDRFLRSGRSGFYLSVEQEGAVAAGDNFQLLHRESDSVTISEINRLFVREKYNQDLLLKAIQTAALPENWREYFSERLGRAATK
ncbi:MAG TPA: MOSC domain-containing protein [Candidatus Sulfotelmatobacter sp.]|nr:MOSC domain-containing protein [Candidatus Sulfotelmatobacter sp.]